LSKLLVFAFLPSASSTGGPLRFRYNSIPFSSTPDRDKGACDALLYRVGKKLAWTAALSSLRFRYIRLRFAIVTRATYHHPFIFVTSSTTRLRRYLSSLRISCCNRRKCISQANQSPGGSGQPPPLCLTYLLRSLTCKDLSLVKISLA
jgi:hypothetical protein